MDNIAIGSDFELSLRLLLLLDMFYPNELDAQQIGTIDFIAIYAADFNLMDENLHGNNSYRYSVYPARKNMIDSVLNGLVLDRLIQLNTTPSGYKFLISDSGKEICRNLSSEYAEEYTLALESVKKRFDDGDYRKMKTEIDRMTDLSLEGGLV